MIKFENEARESLKEGIDILARAVKSTLGPKGKTVILYNNGDPIITKDGVTVARAFSSENPFTQLGMDLIRQAASKTAESIGDGTTTATVIAHSMITSAHKYITAGADALLVKQGIDEAIAVVIPELKKHIYRIESTDLATIHNIATISANNDTSIGNLIAETVSKIGIEGTILVEAGNEETTTVETKKGMSLDRGIISSTFVNTEDELSCIIENAYIQVFNHKINNIQQLNEIMTLATTHKKPVLLVVEDINYAALSSISISNAKGLVSCAIIKCPGFGQNRLDILNDLCIATMGHPYTEDSANIGTIERFVGTQDSSYITFTSDYKEEMAKRILTLKQTMKSVPATTIPFLEKRISYLNKGIATIIVGGTTEKEMVERKDRIDDAVCAVKSAVENGFIAGGGLNFLRGLEAIKTISSEEPDVLLGIEIVKQALQAPFTAIVENAGRSKEAILANVDTSNGIGYNALTDKIECLISAGIIDPADISIKALEYGASICKSFISTECIII